jgi:oxygen-dependent protoporphyrinogen oxidase
MSKKISRVAVVGAGITGLVTAWKLQKFSVEVDLFERKAEPGGAIKTVKEDNWQVEYGPNTLLLKDRMVAEFITELGLNGEKKTANAEANKRFVVKNGVLEPLPSSFKSAVTTPLFSFGGKLRVLAEPFISKNSDRDQTVAEFVERRLGKEMLEYAINPFVAGIYANRPENLSLRHAFPMMDDLEQEYGSLIWGTFAGSKKRKERGRIKRELISFEKGMQQLPVSIAKQLNSMYLNHEVRSVTEQEGKWSVESSLGKFGPYDHVILNTPIYKLNQDMVSITAQELNTLKKVNYPPLSVMLLGFKKEDVQHELDGFGFLVPEQEKRNILGALFSSTLFDDRAPQDMHLLTIFVGGGRQPELAEKDSEDLLELVMKDLDDLIGLSGEPQFKDHVYWPQSIPGYHVGYDDILDTIKNIEDRNRGITLAGNFRNGISVPDCIKNGLKLADQLAGSVNY